MKEEGHVVHSDQQEVTPKGGPFQRVTSEKRENSERERTQDAEREFGEDDLRPQKDDIHCGQFAKINQVLPRLS
jgi:hypothetical protein